MNADRLLALYERVANAPDAIARLRRFVLDLATRGKLVEQNPADVPVPEIALPIKEKLRGQVNVAAKPPFTLPPAWAWRAIGTIAEQVTDGEHATPPRISELQVPLVTAKNVRHGFMDYSQTDWVSFETAEKAWKRCRPRVNDLLLVCVGATTGRLTVLREPRDMVLVRSVALIRPTPSVDPEFLERAIRSPAVQTQVWASVKAAAQPGLYINRITSLLVPLPPLTEQHRIVAKVDELIALCDRLEEARTAREDTRDRLTKASLARLSASDTDDVTFRSHARFAVDVLPTLTARADQVAHLRQTILNLAIRGKLVEQDPADESTSKLLKRLQKLPPPARYAKRSPELIAGDCGMSINKPDLPAPSGWLWLPLVQVARIESGHTPSRSRPEWWDGDVPWMGLVDARAHNNGRIYDTIQHTNEAGLANSAARLLPEGTVCFSRTASVGYVVIMGRPMATSQDFVNWVPTEVLSSEWLQLVMMAERPAISRFSKGAVHQTIYYPAWLSMHVVLPPLAEQHRIVAKVDELMVLCDRLQSSLAVAGAARNHLLKSLLHEALGPTKCGVKGEPASPL